MKKKKKQKRMQKWNLFAIVFSHSTALSYFGKISEGNQDKLYAQVVLQVIVKSYRQ